jgi:hypothetical protein
MLTKRLKPGQLFTANGKVFRIRNSHFMADCDVCRRVNNDFRCMADKGGFLCSTVCGYGHYPQFIRNAK